MEALPVISFVSEAYAKTIALTIKSTSAPSLPRNTYVSKVFEADRNLERERRGRPFNSDAAACEPGQVCGAKEGGGSRSFRR